MGRKPIGGIFSVGVEEPYRWKDSVQSAAEIRIWVADGIANGLRPWFTKFAGTLHDRALAQVGRGPLPLASRRTSATCATRSRSPGSAWSTRSRPPGSTAAERAARTVEDHALGWYQALIEARIPFEMVHDRLLDADHLARFKTLILPNIAALSDAQCAAAPRVRRARRRPRRDLRDVALRRVGRRSARTSAWPTSSASFRRARPRGRCRTPTCGSSTTRAPAATRCSPASRTRRGSSTASRGST